MAAPEQGIRMATTLDRLRNVGSNRIAVVLGTVVVAAGWGLLAGVWTPRGPMTTAQALGSIATSLAVGTLAGWWMRSRWAMLLAPAVFAGVFELTRMSVDGPLVDGIRLASGGTFGLLAFILGRGLHAVLALLPMLLGSALGAGLARREQSPARNPRSFGVISRRVVAVVTAVALAALSVGLVRPAGTDPILTAAGEPLADSIAELDRIQLGGQEQAMMVRGRSTDNPVLLFLAGGPGGTELGAMRRHAESLEDDFVVVTWDQRGTGKSYGSLDPVSTLTLDQAVSDTVEVTDYLRDRFGQDRIYLLGQSYGTILGVLAAQRHPELYRAYIGVGQMVDPRETDEVFYRDTLALARRNGNTALIDSLTASGPPPYTDMLDYESSLSNTAVYAYDHSRNSEGVGGFSSNLFVREYSLLEQLHAFAGFFDVFTVLYPQLQDIDFRTDVPRLEVPVYLAEGRFEAPGRLGPAEQWLELLDAPTKNLTTFETSGHRPLFEQPELFDRFMVETVLAQT